MKTWNRIRNVLGRRKPLMYHDPPTLWEKNHYKDLLEMDIGRIATRLKLKLRTLDTEFPAWDFTVPHEFKPRLIDDAELYKALQHLSDALNARNEYRYTKHFRFLNQKALLRLRELRKLKQFD